MLTLVDTLTRLAHKWSSQFFSSAKPKLEILYDFGGKASDGERWSLLPEPETRSFEKVYRIASVNSSCAQPLPPSHCGAFARLVSPGGGAFANFALPGGRAFANPGAIPELLTRTRFPIRI